MYIWLWIYYCLISISSRLHGVSTNEIISFVTENAVNQHAYTRVGKGLRGGR